MNKTPRPHQTATIEKLKQSLMAGKKRPMIQLPTGAGKTFIAAMIIEGALKKGNKVLFVVPALSLIDQTVQAFWNEGINEVGVIQGDHWLTDYSKPVQVASVQTLMRRELPECGIVIIDEAHRMFKFCNDWMTNPDWQNIPFVGLSATPWTKGLGKYYDDLIIGETAQGLIDKGILTPFNVFAPSHPDLTGVKTVAGDYHEGQLSEAMSKKHLVAGIVSTWLEKGESRPTFCFAVDCAHARKIQTEFQEAGVNCGYIDAFTKADERALVKEAFERGELKVVCNVGTLTTGVDWDVRCIIFARPTQSEMLYVQCVGRGLRTAQGKESCLILDHSDNTLRLGFVTDIARDQLCTGKKGESSSEKRKKKEKLPKECGACSYLKPPGVHKCPSCGFAPMKQSNVFEAEGELVAIKSTGNREFSMKEKQAWYSGFLYIRDERGYKSGWAANQYKDKFGVWPRGLHENPIYPQIEVTNFVKSKMIRWAKSHKKQEINEARIA